MQAVGEWTAINLGKTRLSYDEEVVYPYSDADLLAYPWTSNYNKRNDHTVFASFCYGLSRSRRSEECIQVNVGKDASEDPGGPFATCSRVLWITPAAPSYYFPHVYSTTSGRSGYLSCSYTF